MKMIQNDYWTNIPMFQTPLVPVEFRMILAGLCCKDERKACELIKKCIRYEDALGKPFSGCIAYRVKIAPIDLLKGR